MTRAAGLRACVIAVGGSALLVTSAGLPAWGSAPDSPAAALAAEAALNSAAQVPAGWTGSVAGCAVGGESAESLQATLAAVNLLRSAAGLGPVTFEEGRNQKALAAALIMKAQNDLSHFPGEEWACYSDIGADGASHSNLYLGRSGAAAMLGYVLDEGVSSLGHRRWLLDPAATAFGSGSTGTTNALWVLPGDARAEVPSGSVVAWPPAGHVPAAWVPSVWSVAVGGEGDLVTAGSLQVTMLVDGQTVPVVDAGFLTDGFGTGTTLYWQPGVDLAEFSRGARRVDVTISGLSVDEVATPVAYTVNVVPPPASTRPNPDPQGGQPTDKPGSSNPDPTPTATPTSPVAAVRLKATSRRSKLHVNVDPDLPGKWRFIVYRGGAGGRWEQKKTYTTKGKRETRTVNLPKGTYRVVVQPRAGYGAVTSQPVELRR